MHISERLICHARKIPEEEASHEEICTHTKEKAGEAFSGAWGRWFTDARRMANDGTAGSNLGRRI